MKYVMTMRIEHVEYVDEDIGRVYRKKPRTTSMQYIIQIPSSLGRNPKFPFKHGEPVKIKLNGNRIIVEKLEKQASH